MRRRTSNRVCVSSGAASVPSHASLFAGQTIRTCDSHSRLPPPTAGPRHPPATCPVLFARLARRSGSSTTSPSVATTVPAPSRAAVTLTRPVPAPTSITRVAFEMVSGQLARCNQCAMANDPSHTTDPSPAPSCWYLPTSTAATRGVCASACSSGFHVQSGTHPRNLEAQHGRHSARRLTAVLPLLRFPLGAPAHAVAQTKSGARACGRHA